MLVAPVSSIVKDTGSLVNVQGVGFCFFFCALAQVVCGIQFDTPLMSCFRPCDLAQHRRDELMGSMVAGQTTSSGRVLVIEEPNSWRVVGADDSNTVIWPLVAVRHATFCASCCVFENVSVGIDIYRYFFPLNRYRYLSILLF